MDCRWAIKADVYNANCVHFGVKGIAVYERTLGATERTTVYGLPLSGQPVLASS